MNRQRSFAPLVCALLCLTAAICLRVELPTASGQSDAATLRWRATTNENGSWQPCYVVRSSSDVTAPQPWPLDAVTTNLALPLGNYRSGAVQFFSVQATNLPLILFE